MPAFRESKPLLARALQSMREKDLFNGALVPWIEEMINAVANHRDPAAAVEALCILKNYIDENQALSRQYRPSNMSLVITMIGNVPEPFSYIHELLSGIELLKQSINLFGFEIRPLLSRALQQSIFPVVMARLLLCFAKTGLFSEAVSASVAKANFEKLISVSPVWVNHQVLDHIFERRMFNEFSQDLFDNLIVASKNLHDLKSYFRVLLSDKDSSSSPRVRNQQSAFVGRFFATNQELTFEESHMEQDAPSFPQP